MDAFGIIGFTFGTTAFTFALVAMTSASAAVKDVKALRRALEQQGVVEPEEAAAGASRDRHTSD